MLCTDGILERRDKAGEFFGVERLRAVVREKQDEPAQAVLDALFEAALAWGDRRPWEDDATIVVVKRRGRLAGACHRGRGALRSGRKRCPQAGRHGTGRRRPARRKRRPARGAPRVVEPVGERPRDEAERAASAAPRAAGRSQRLARRRPSAPAAARRPGRRTRLSGSARPLPPGTSVRKVSPPSGREAQPAPPVEAQEQADREVAQAAGAVVEEDGLVGAGTATRACSTQASRAAAHGAPGERLCCSGAIPPDAGRDHDRSDDGRGRRPHEGTAACPAGYASSSGFQGIVTKEKDALPTRVEKDSFGPIEVPAERLWGAQTQRSLEQLPHLRRAHAARPRPRPRPREEGGGARPRRARRRSTPRRAGRSCAAADEVLAGRWDDEFPLVVWQTGSGTQTNMNVNEVLANRASEILGGPRGEGRLVHPNDDVNRGQSTNDAFPTAIHVARGRGHPAGRRSRRSRACATRSRRRRRPSATSSRSAAPTSWTRRRSPSARRSRAGRPSSTTAERASSRRCPASASWPSAARRSAPASTPTPSCGRARRRGSPS